MHDPATAISKGKTPDELIKEADLLPITTKYSKKLALYQQAANNGSILALTRLGDLYAETFKLKRESVEMYIKTQNITDMSQLKQTLENNKTALDYYIQAWQAADKESDTMKQVELKVSTKKGVLELFKQMKECHSSLLLAFFNIISSENNKLLHESFKINLNKYNEEVPTAKSAFFSKEKIVNNAHITKYGFNNNTLALIGVKFLNIFLNIKIVDYNNPSTNHNLAELGSFFLTLLNSRIANNAGEIKMTDSTAEIIGQYFLAHKEKVLAYMPMDTYQLEQQKTTLDHGVFILQQMIKKSWDNIALFIFVLTNVLETKEFNLQNLASPSLEKEINLGKVTEEFLRIIKECERHKAQTQHIAAATERMRDMRMTN